MGEGGRGLGETCEDVVWKDLEVSQGMRRKRAVPGGGNHGYLHSSGHGGLPGPQRRDTGKGGVDTVAGRLQPRGDRRCCCISCPDVPARCRVSP